MKTDRPAGGAANRACDGRLSADDELLHFADQNCAAPCPRVAVTGDQAVAASRRVLARGRPGFPFAGRSSEATGAGPRARAPVPLAEQGREVADVETGMGEVGSYQLAAGFVERRQLDRAPDLRRNYPIVVGTAARASAVSISERCPLGAGLLPILDPAAARVAAGKRKERRFGSGMRRLPAFAASVDDRNRPELLGVR